MVSGEEVERDVDFDDRIQGRGFDEPQVGKVAPRLVLEVLDGTVWTQGSML
jgi:hypothetical protein